MAAAVYVARIAVARSLPAPRRTEASVTQGWVAGASCRFGVRFGTRTGGRTTGQCATVLVCRTCHIRPEIAAVRYGSEQTSWRLWRTVATVQRRTCHPETAFSSGRGHGTPTKRAGGPGMNDMERRRLAAIEEAGIPALERMMEIAHPADHEFRDWLRWALAANRTMRAAISAGGSARAGSGGTASRPLGPLGPSSSRPLGAGRRRLQAVPDVA